MTRGPRRLITLLLGLLACIAILLTLLVGYADHVLVNAAQFTGRAQTVFDNGSVRTLITQRITDDVVREQPGYLTSVRPQIYRVVRRQVSSNELDASFGVAVRDLHDEVLSGDARALTLSIPGVGDGLSARLASTSPQLAQLVRDVGSANIYLGQVPAAATKVAHAISSAGDVTLVLGAIALLLMMLALLISAHRRRTLVRLGIGAAIDGALVFAAYLLLRPVVTGHFSGTALKSVAGVVWDTYLHGLMVDSLILLGAGLVVAVLGTALRRP